MSCTERCRKAGPGACCCSCEGQHHGEAGPQPRLAFEVKLSLPAPKFIAPIIQAMTPLVETHAEDCACDACRSDVRRVAKVEDARALEPVSGIPGDGEPSRAGSIPAPTTVDLGRGESLTVYSIQTKEQVDTITRVIDGHQVELAPGERPDGSPVWIAHAGDRVAFDSDPDVAARKALER